MSQENVEVVRVVMRLLDRAGRGEHDDARLLDLVAPAVEIDMSRRTFNPDVYRGHHGLRRLSREVRDVWETFVITPERFIDAAEGVGVRGPRRGRGRGGGVGVEDRSGGIWKIREGQVIRMETDLQPRVALEAVGLTE